MFNLQFEKIHQYLFPRTYDDESGLPVSGQGIPQYPLLNPSQPRSGIHVCRETIFTSGSLAFICYAKNTFSHPESNDPQGVKVCLKITAGIRKSRGSYGSPRVQGETVSFECKMSDMVGIWRVLRGSNSSYSIYLPLPGCSPKSFDLKYQPSSSEPYFAEVHEGRTAIRVSFDEGAAFSFQAVVLAVARVLYPHLDAYAAVAMLDAYKTPQVITAAPPGNSETPAEPQGKPAFEPDLKAEGDEDLRPGLRKAIYAICLQSWPAKRKDVAQYIQRHAGQRAGQRIVDAANSGDFTELDDIAEYLDAHD